MVTIIDATNVSYSRNYPGFLTSYERVDSRSMPVGNRALLSRHSVLLILKCKIDL